MPKFGDYNAASSLDGTEIILLKKDGETVRTTLSELVALVESSSFESGTFTGVIPSTSNITITSATDLNYTRTLDMVTVYGRIYFTATDVGISSLSLNLPIFSNIEGVHNGGGSGIVSGASSEILQALLTVNGGTDPYIQFNIVIENVGSHFLTFSYNYRLI